MVDDITPDHGRWLESILASQSFMSLLGVELDSYSSGLCQLGLTSRPDLQQHSGVIHAGAVAALADNAAGGAASTMLPTGTAAITVEYKISFVGPARGDRLVARAEAIHSGKSIIHCVSRVYAVTDGEETLCAIALVTLWPQRVARTET